jgi:uncharacterized damage-inducible protein DinB
MSDQRIHYILATLDPPPGSKLWYGGASLLGSIRGISAREAHWKPAPDRHSIWELVLHTAYWKYAGRRSITGEPKGGFPRSPANWPFTPEKPDEKQWKEDCQLLRDQHEQLVEAIGSLDPARLDQKISVDAKWTYADLLMGILTHDMYHTGQLVMMKRLYKSLNK